MEEAYRHIVDFANSNETDPKIIAERGQIIVNAISSRLVLINDEKGISEFCFGGIIKKLRENEAWKFFPDVQEHWMFGDFCREVLDMSQSKAMGLLRVWEKSQLLHMTPEQVDCVGWSTADAILRTAKTKEEVDALITRYEQADSRKAFLDSLKSPSVLGEIQERRPRKRRVLKVEESEDQFLQETLERAAKKMGGELNRDFAPEKVIIFILAEWRQLTAKE